MSLQQTIETAIAENSSVLILTNLNDNDFECLRDNLPCLSNTLTELTIINSTITSLPKLDTLVNLQKLDVSNNALKFLPSMESLVNLRILNVSNNALRFLPNLESLSNLIELNSDGNINTLPNISPP